LSNVLWSWSSDTFHLSIFSVKKTVYAFTVCLSTVFSFKCFPLTIRILKLLSIFLLWTTKTFQHFQEKFFFYVWKSCPPDESFNHSIEINYNRTHQHEKLYSISDLIKDLTDSTFNANTMLWWRVTRTKTDYFLVNENHCELSFFT
jgi:hypothetical protein